MAKGSSSGSVILAGLAVGAVAWYFFARRPAVTGKISSTFTDLAQSASSAWEAAKQAGAGPDAPPRASAGELGWPTLGKAEGQ